MRIEDISGTIYISGYGLRIVRSSRSHISRLYLSFGSYIDNYYIVETLNR